MFRILMPDARFEGEPDIEREIAGRDAELNVYKEEERARVPADLWEKSDALVIYHKTTVNAELLDRARRVKIVVRSGVGYDNVDLQECGRRGIPVCNTPDYGLTEVADHAIALMLTLVRGVSYLDETLRADPVGAWRFDAAPAVKRIRGGVFGVIGMGWIGVATARRAKAFDMDVVFYDPYLPPGAELGLGYRRAATLESLLGEADVISLNVRLSEETRGIIGPKTVPLMKPGMVIVNTARGPLVDLDALHDGLKSGQISAAGLDVLQVEPAPVAHPLIAAWTRNEPWVRGRLILTPHSAFYTPVGYKDLRQKAIGTAVGYLRDGSLRYCVNRHVLDFSKARVKPA